tara:strand:+ start:763 stop:1944 length:1182 start_codon:yes stop_codon:yes gene_type:complete
MIKKILDTRFLEGQQEVFYCRQCVNSNQRPGLTFDEENVCDACQYSEIKHSHIDWEEREQELIRLLNNFRSTDGSFDVIVPSSGGKDSCFVAHQLKHFYGMHPLAVTWAPGLYTEIGWKNLQNFRNAGFNSILGLPDNDLYSKLATLGFQLSGDPFWPWHYGQRAYPLSIAAKFKIPLVIYGERTGVEYGGGKQFWYKSTEDIEDLENSINTNAKYLEILVEEGIRSGILDKSDTTGLEQYRYPSSETVNSVGLEVHWFSYYKKWTPQDNYYYAVNHCGFEPNPKRTEGTYSKYASLDDKLDGLHFFMQYIKYGLGRCTSEASQEIRSGHITREEAIALVKQYDGEFPEEYFVECLEFLKLTETNFWEVVDKFRAPHLWQMVDGKWQLKHMVS